MTVYITILILSSVFSFCYSKASDKSARVVFLICCFLSLFIPAAFRYGIGVDYANYAKLYKHIGEGRQFNVEIGFILICKFLNLLGLSYHFLFVVFSFLTLFFLFLAIPRKYFYLAIPCYVMLVYESTYTAIRQELACAIFLFACRFFLEKKYKRYIFWCIIAVLNHKSVVLLSVLLPLFQLLPLLSPRKYIILYVSIFSALLVFKYSIVNFIMEKILVFTPYAAYAFKAQAQNTEGGTGLGVLLKLFIVGLLLYLSLTSTESKRIKKFSIGFSFSIMLATEFSAVIYIFFRLVGIMGVTYVYLFILASKSQSKYRKQLLCFAYTLLIPLFIKNTLGAVIQQITVVSGKHIYPYVSIFNWRNNEMIYNRMSKI